MSCRFLLLSLSIFWAGCSPALNWREVRPAGGELKAMLPCKADQGQRSQVLAGRQIELQMLGCEAGGALYAIAVAELGDGRDAQAVQVQWQGLLLGNMRASTSASSNWALKGMGETMQPVRLTAAGQDPEGRPIAAQAVWFARGSRLYHAVIYGERISSEMSEPFFGALELP